jgi:hypothetical protein
VAALLRWRIISTLTCIVVLFFLNKSAMAPKFQIPTSNFQGSSKSKIPKIATGAIHLEIGGSKFLWDLVLGIWDF